MIFRLALVAAVSAALLGCTTAPESAKPFDPTAPKAHHTADGFRNLYINDGHKAGFFEFLFKVRLAENWPDEAELAKNPPIPQVPVDLEALKAPPKDDLQVTWIGHSTMLIQYRGTNILTDPIFAERASPFSFVGPKRYTAAALDITDLPPIDAIVISHNHYDHMDAYTIEAIGNSAKWLVPLGNAALLKSHDVTNVVELDWWEKDLIGDITFTLTPTQHWSGRGLTDRYKALWGSWAIQFPNDGMNVWFGGDTGYNPVQFKEIGDKHGPFDMSFIPIGAYAPRWFMRHSHVNPEEAVQIHRDIRSRKSIGMHWGTFVLTAEPVEEPPVALKKAAEAAGLGKDEFITLPIGGTEVMKSTPSTRTANRN